jgi:hypothetical protein
LQLQRFDAGGGLVDGLAGHRGWNTQTLKTLKQSAAGGRRMTNVSFFGGDERNTARGVAPRLRLCGQGLALKKQEHPSRVQRMKTEQDVYLSGVRELVKDLNRNGNSSSQRFINRNGLIQPQDSELQMDIGIAYAYVLPSHSCVSAGELFDGRANRRKITADI